MMTKEIVLQFKGPILKMIGGVVTMSIPQIEFVNELLSDDFDLIKNIVAILGGALFFWQAYHGVSKHNREKDQEYEEKKLDIERKAWQLAHDQKRANEEGLIEVIKDLDKDMKELKETIKNMKK